MGRIPGSTANRRRDWQEWAAHCRHVKRQTEQPEFRPGNARPSEDPRLTQEDESLTPSDASVADVLIAGLTAPVSDAESEAARRPPYLTPPSQAPLRGRLLRELTARLPDEGDGPPVITRILAGPRPYRSKVSLLAQSAGFDFSDAACALLAAGALDDADVSAVVGFLPSCSGFRRQLVLNRIAVGDLEGARAEADRVGEYRWTGYRDIAAVLADGGDVPGFLADWKRYSAGRSRDWMQDLKRRLVIGVAKNEGWRAALAVIGDKRIGATFARYAFSALPEGDVEGLQRLLEGKAAGVLSEKDELGLLVQAVCAATGKAPERDHPLLGAIVDRIIAVDPTTDKATMRWRDGKLVALWPAFGEQATLERVRSAVRTPVWKRELTELAREVNGPAPAKP